MRPRRQRVYRHLPPYVDAPYTVNPNALADLVAADEAIRAATEQMERAKQAAVEDILARLDAAGLTVSKFCAMTGIYRAGFYELVTGKEWSPSLAIQALDLLSTPLTDDPT